MSSSSNDPYSGGTHFNDVRVARPIFRGRVSSSRRHRQRATGGTSAAACRARSTYRPASTSARAFRIPPITIYPEGRFSKDIARLLVGNTRAPRKPEGDLLSQAEATRVAEREVLRLVARYGRETVVTAFREVHHYVNLFDPAADRAAAGWDVADQRTTSTTIRPGARA